MSFAHEYFCLVEKCQSAVGGKNAMQNQMQKHEKGI